MRLRILKEMNLIYLSEIFTQFFALPRWRAVHLKSIADIALFGPDRGCHLAFGRLRPISEIMQVRIEMVVLEVERVLSTPFHRVWNKMHV